jgi:hypothetical protein
VLYHRHVNGHGHGPGHGHRQGTDMDIEMDTDFRHGHGHRHLAWTWTQTFGIDMETDITIRQGSDIDGQVHLLLSQQSDKLQNFCLCNEQTGLGKNAWASVFCFYLHQTNRSLPFPFSVYIYICTKNGTIYCIINIYVYIYTVYSTYNIL